MLSKVFIYCTRLFFKSKNLCLNLSEINNISNAAMNYTRKNKLYKKNVKNSSVILNVCVLCHAVGLTLSSVNNVCNMIDLDMCFYVSWLMGCFHPTFCMTMRNYRACSWCQIDDSRRSANGVHLLTAHSVQ